MSSETTDNTEKTSFTTVTAHNDSIVIRRPTGSSIFSSGGVTSVPESIVHPQTRAVPVATGIEGIDENPAISPGLAAIVAKKAFAIYFTVTDIESNAAGRYGQGGFIRCPSKSTLPGCPPSAKRQKVTDVYRSAPIPLQQAIKQSSSPVRVSAMPFTALHNVLKDYFRNVCYDVPNVAVMANNYGYCKVKDFKQRNEAYSSEDAISINFPDASSLSWKYGFDITSGHGFRKKTPVETDPDLSFEAVPPCFEYKVGQKIGIAVYRNYKLDFTNDEIYTNNGWNKRDFPKDEIMQIFGADNSVNIYTGEIVAVSSDKKVFCHDINTFRGCSGAIVFLLDKNQDEEDVVKHKHCGKAIGVHVGTFDDETTRTPTAAGSSSSKKEYNFAFALAGLVED